MYVEFDNAEEIKEAAKEAIEKYVAAEHVNPAWERVKVFSWRDMLALKEHIAELERQLQAKTDDNSVKPHANRT